MNALLLVNGELTGADILRRRIHSHCFHRVIGVDGGSRHAGVLGVTLDTIIGDMDSLPDIERSRDEDCRFIAHPVKKGATDLELALIYAASQGAESIVLVGAAGGRLDMTVANVMLLAREQLKGCRVEIWEGIQTAWLVRPPGEQVCGSPGDTVSFIPLGGHVSGITLSGFVYPLDDATLSPGETRGVSNLMDEAQARISFSSGLLLAVRTPANPECQNGGMS